LAADVVVAGLPLRVGLQIDVVAAVGPRAAVVRIVALARPHLRLGRGAGGRAVGRRQRFAAGAGDGPDPDAVGLVVAVADGHRPGEGAALDPGAAVDAGVHRDGTAVVGAARIPGQLDRLVAGLGRGAGGRERRPVRGHLIRGGGGRPGLRL